MVSLITVPAVAFAGTENPGGEYTPEEVPPGYTGTENPGGEYLPEEIPVPEEVPVPEGIPVPEEVPPSYTGIENPSSGQTPEGVPPGYTANENPASGQLPGEVPPAYSGNENPGISHQLSGGEARALGRDECQQFKQNFHENRWEFGRCIAAVAMALHSGATPQKTCAARGLSRRPQSGERRSDFSACVIAAARALRQQSS